MVSPRVITLGCRLNSAESEVMKAWAIEQKLENAIIVNTCAVTTHAERQARQTIRHLRKENPGALIIATGCAVQLRPQAFAAMKEIDRVIGNGIKSSPESFSRDFDKRVDVGPIPLSTTQERVPVIHMQGKPKAFVQVQNGCNHFCTFCTIPLARGRSRSVPIDILCPQIESLLEQGVREIILTGVDLTSYREGGLTLGSMIKALLDRIPTLERVRLSSLDSMEVEPDLEDLILHESRILPHIHLSLQAGSNPILQAMKRRHTREQAVDLCQRLKHFRPEIALGADFIAGFPGETEALFHHTLALVDECDLTHLHVFPFSKRPGTLAARMNDQVNPKEIKERASMLREKGKAKLESWLSTQKGKTIQVLAEQAYKGHANDFSVVELTDPVVSGNVIQALVTGHTATHLIACPL